MSMFTDELEGKRGEYWKKFAEKELIDCKQDFYLTTYIDDEGVLRWVSSNNVPPEDCFEKFILAGCKFDVEKSRKVREEETMKSLHDYKEKMEHHIYSEEEKEEMRAAFGTGTTVVNVITGRKIRI